MRRLLVCALALLCAVLPLSAPRAEQLASVPAIFDVSYDVKERKENNNRRFVSKEYLQTTNARVNEELKALADDLDERLLPVMQDDPKKNPRRNSRLDIEAVHTLTGQSWMSVLLLGRVSFNRAQVCSPFYTRTWDLQTGERVLLTDIFPADSPAWDFLASRVREHVSGLFPQDARNPQAVEALCTRDAIQNADFTLSAMELTLHYTADQVYEGRPCLMHVRFFYDELWPWMTEEARRQTDNSAYKVVAITCDDGPAYAETANALTNFRREGIRATFFTVGKRVAGNPDILLREFDQNHIIASHTYNHWSGYSEKPETRLKELSDHNALLETLTGEHVTLFRAPGGTYPPWVEAGIGLPIIQWSVDTYDYTGKAANKIFYSIRNNVQDGDVILSHDSGKQMYKSIPLFAKWFRQNGYLAVTVEELARMNGVNMQPNVVYYRFLDGETGKRRDSNTN